MPLLICLFILKVAAGSALALELDAGSLGITPFYRTFYGNITITPTPGVEESVITYEGVTGPFDSSWVGKEFVAFRAHLNGNSTPPAGSHYLAGVLSCRYATVTSVTDSKNLVVNFKYNGGNPSSPATQVHANGYFFVDCTTALKNALTTINTSGHANYGATAINFNNDVYVFKGLSSIPINLTNFPLSFKCGTTGQKTQFKLSMEDTYWGIDDKYFFLLNTGGNDFTADIEFLPPHYTLPMVNGSINQVIAYTTSTQVARNITIKNSICNSEELALVGTTLPAGANFVMPGWVYSPGGGTRNSTDVTGFQSFILENSYWRAKTLTSIKNNNGGGNFMDISDSTVIEDLTSKVDKIENVDLKFTVDGTYGARNVEILSPHATWEMVANQYWLGGTSTSTSEPTQVNVGGYNLYFGNNGDWQVLLGYYPGSETVPGRVDIKNARMFDRIPQVGDTIALEDKGSGNFFVHGWGLQLGDALTISGTNYTISTRTRTNYLVSGSVYRHGFLVKFSTTPPGGTTSGVVSTSNTAFLLTGTHTGKLMYSRDLNGHLFYNRAEVGYSIRDTYMKGFFRNSGGNANSEGGDGSELWQCPITKEMINCVHEPQTTNGNISEQYESGRLLQRSMLTGTAHRILISGGAVYAARSNNNRDEVELIDRPALIYGGPSYGAPKLINPVTDGQGLVGVSNYASAALFVIAEGGATVDMSNLFLTTRRLATSGTGTIIIDNLDIDTSNGPNPGSFVEFSGTNALTLTGSNGRGALRIVNAGSPAGNSIVLTGWTLLPGDYNPTGYSSSWPALSGAVTINGVAK